MSRSVSALAGKPASRDILINVPKLITAYYIESPDPKEVKQRVSFGTAGHRGSSLEKTFNEAHILAITQAICFYRTMYNITGPLFLGMDTHALSMPAYVTALEVLAANDVEVMIAPNDEYTPTPAVSRAIISYNLNRTMGLADGIVITPSHNPPADGGFKYNPPHGGPADKTTTDWIGKKANELLENKLNDVRRVSITHAKSMHRYDFLNAYVDDLSKVIDMDVIRNANLCLAVDPLGGAGIHYWSRIAEKYGLNLTVVDQTIDPTFSLMPVDWDGQIRMDPSSPYVMGKLVKLKNQFDIAFACDTDNDRHGIVTREKGLLSPNHYLAIAIFYLFQNRSLWPKSLGVGKTIVSSNMIDRVIQSLGRKLHEVPVGFKWFVEGLMDGSLGFAGEESAGATFNQLDGSVWTTDKDGISLALLSAEITARMNCDLGEIYSRLEHAYGKTFYERIDVAATPAQKQRLLSLSTQDIRAQVLAGDSIQSILTHAPGNNAAIGGLKISTANGWCVIRPSGTEDIYKIYAESFKGEDHLQRLIADAQIIINETLEAVK